MRGHFLHVALLVMLGVVLQSGILLAQVMPADREAGLLYVPPPIGNGADAIFNPGPAAPTVSDPAWQRAILTHVALIGNKTVLIEAAANPNTEINKTKWYSRFKTPADAGAVLAQDIHVAQVPGTGLIEVWLGGDADAQESRTIVVGLVNHYMDRTHTSESGRLIDEVTLLTSLANRWDTQIREIRGRMAKAIVDAEMSRPTDRKPTTQELIDSKQAELDVENLRSELASLQSLWERNRDRLAQLNSQMTHADISLIRWAVRPGVSGAP